MPIATARPMDTDLDQSRCGDLENLSLRTLAFLFWEQLASTAPASSDRYPAANSCRRSRYSFLLRGKRAFDRQYLWFYVWVGAWLLGTIIADEYNAIGLFNQAKGTARVAFFALDFVAPGDPAK